METVTINGIGYVKANVLAKRFNYTTDYLGQLCRGRKIDAQLVGRTWYINPLSVEDHKVAKKTKQQSPNKSRLDDKKFIYNVEINKSRIEVPSVVTRNTAKSIANFSPKRNFEERISWTPARYESDESDLLPTVLASREPIKIAIEHAESNKLPVNSTSRVVNLTATHPPTVSLRGKLDVSSIDDAFTAIPEIESDQIELSGEIAFSPDIASQNNPNLESSFIEYRSLTETQSTRNSPLTKSTSVKNKDAYTVPLRRIAMPQESLVLEGVENAVDDHKTLSFTPNRVRSRGIQDKPDVLLVTGQSGSNWLWRGLVIVLALLSAFAVSALVIERVELVNSETREAGFRWSMSR